MPQHDSQAIQDAKSVVLDLCHEFDNAEPDELTSVLERYTGEQYRWRGLHPFDEQLCAADAVDTFWKPLHLAFNALQRRVDVFFAGHNVVDNQPSTPIGIQSVQAPGDIWTCQMGHFMGLMDQPWLDIPPTRRVVFIRFAEFHRVQNGRITESALFFDLISIMRQAGHYPLPPCTGAAFICPGPATGDGLLFDTHPPMQASDTVKLMQTMIEDLSAANETAQENGNDRVPREVLARCWSERMLWFGPDGIGSTYTIDRYQQQHQYPFRLNLSGKRFNGHVARFAEANYGCFFGWPNLTNVATGNFLGLTGSQMSADMRVTDVYRRDGDKLVENWVIIDLPHWLHSQGLDVLARMRQLIGIETL